MLATKYNRCAQKCRNVLMDDLKTVSSSAPVTTRTWIWVTAAANTGDAATSANANANTNATSKLEIPGRGMDIFKGNLSRAYQPRAQHTCRHHSPSSAALNLPHSSDRVS